MTNAFDQSFWEAQWLRVQQTHGDAIAAKQPNNRLTEFVADRTPGRALDAGCGHGAETMWLATRGWHVTAVDFSTTALDIGRAIAADLGVTDRVEWVQADLGAWAPQPSQYDLVVSLYVHVDGDISESVQRLAAGVAPGGTLFMVGRQGIEQTQITIEAARDALPGWELLVASELEEAERAGGGVDAVIAARRAP